MQPEDPKQDFTPPAEAPYVSDGVPAEPLTESSVESEPQLETPEPAVEPDTSEEVAESSASSAQLTETEPVHWQAAEYHQHDKSVGWFLAFGVVVVLLMAAAIFLIHSSTFTVLIPVMAAALIVFSRRPPRQMDYSLSSKGLYINDTLHNFSEFKGFGVIHDGDDYSIMMIPVRRFQPGVSVYFPEESGEAIVDMLGVRLPMQSLKLDAFDRIIRALHI